MEKKNTQLSVVTLDMHRIPYAFSVNIVQMFK